MASADAAAHAAQGSDHFVQFYEDDALLVEAVANFVATSLQDGSGGIMVTTPRHRGPVLQRLARRGLDLGRLESEGRWVSLDAEETLDTFMVDGMPDIRRFRDAVEPLLDRMGRVGNGGVRAFGEMVAVLWERGNREAAISLERLWNVVLRERSVSLFCAYPLRAFGGDGAARDFLEVCEEHQHVLPSEDFSRLSTQDDRHRLVLELQRKALALDEEVARRREIEDLLRRREKETFEYLQGAAEAVVDVRPSGTVLWGNTSFLAMLGDERIESRSLRDVILPDTAFDEIWAKLLRGETLEGLCVDLRRADGRIEPVRIRLGALRAAGRDVHMRWFLDRRPCP